MAEFPERLEHELNGLSDAQLIDYIQAARGAGATDTLRRALGTITFRYWENVHGRVRMKVPVEDAEDVTSEIITSAVASRFSGSSIGELRVWLNRITERRIADYYRRPGAHTAPLPDEHQDDEGAFGGFIVDPNGDSAKAADVRMVFGAVIVELNQLHRRVVLLQVEGHSGKECAAILNQEDPGAEMTEDNAHQIYSRFRKRLRQELK